MAELKPRNVKVPQFFRSKWFKISLAAFLFFSIGSSLVVLYYYNYYARMIDRKLSGEISRRLLRYMPLRFAFIPDRN